MLDYRLLLKINLSFVYFVIHDLLTHDNFDYLRFKMITLSIKNDFYLKIN